MQVILPVIALLLAVNANAQTCKFTWTYFCERNI